VPGERAGGKDGKARETARTGNNQRGVGCSTAVVAAV